MSIRDDAVYEELVELARKPGYPVRWGVSCLLNIGGVTAEVVKVLSFNTNGDFHNQYYGHRFLTITVDTLVYRRLVTNLPNITVELTLHQQSRDRMLEDTLYTYSHIFDAKVTDPTNPDFMAVQAGGSSNNQIDQLGFRTVVLQLIDPFLSKYRLAEVGGVVRNADVGTILQVLLGKGLPNVAVSDVLSDPKYPSLRGVDVVKPDNTTVYEQIIIDIPTRLVELPRYLQETTGVYTSGIGWHIYRGRCYVFPQMRYDTFQTDERTMTIINIPETEIPTMEKTFMVRSNQLYVFATGESAHVDVSEDSLTNTGNGLRFIKSSDLLRNVCKVTNNTAAFTREDNVKEYIIDERPEGNNVRFAKNRFTDNPFPELSALSSGLGTRLRVNWDNADPNLLFPGMQIRYLYKHNGVIVKMYGCLTSVLTYTAPATDAITDDQYLTSCTLLVHLQRITNT